MINTENPWCNYTWNWSQGCPGCPDSAELGCKNCYARDRANRWRLDFSTPKRTTKTTFNMPLTSGALKPGDTIFTLSLGDFFHPMNDEIRPDAWKIIRETPYIYLILTKFPENILDRLPEDFDLMIDAGKVWLGFTAENQREMENRAPIILEFKIQFPELKVFCSMEPLLGPIKTNWFGYLDWIITGGESGHHARPTHPDWVRGIRDQCQEAGTPFFFKSWGEWLSHHDIGQLSSNCKQTIIDGLTFYKVGKKNSGHLLDGKEYRELPNFAG